MILLGIIVFFVIPILIGFIGIIIYRSWSCNLESLGMILIGIGTLMIIICAVCFLAEQVEVRNQIIRYNVLKETVEEARKNGDKIERAAVMRDIITNNKVLGSYKYWNKTIFDIFIPDEINDLEMLK